MHTWNGDGDGTNWSDPDNWDADTVPGDDDDVTIPASTTVHKDTAKGGANTRDDCQNLYMASGSALIIDASCGLEYSKVLDISGTVTVAPYIELNNNSELWFGHDGGSTSHFEKIGLRSEADSFANIASVVGTAVNSGMYFGRQHAYDYGAENCRGHKLVYIKWAYNTGSYANANIMDFSRGSTSGRVEPHLFDKCWFSGWSLKAACSFLRVRRSISSYAAASNFPLIYISNGGAALEDVALGYQSFSMSGEDFTPGTSQVSSNNRANQWAAVEARKLVSSYYSSLLAASNQECWNPFASGVNGLAHGQVELSSFGNDSGVWIRQVNRYSAEFFALTNQADPASAGQGDVLLVTPSYSAAVGRYGIGMNFDIELPVESGDVIAPSFKLLIPTGYTNFDDGMVTCDLDPADEWGVRELAVECDSTTTGSWQTVSFTGGTIGGSGLKGTVLLRFTLWLHYVSGKYVAFDDFKLNAS